MQGNDADLQLLIDAARLAGDIAMGYFQSDPQIWEKPEDAGPVTEADLDVDRTLREHLTKARPDYGWLSEETEDDATRLHKERVFIVDPIDGTRAFISGQDSWSHSLAIAENGVIQTGVVFLPVKNRLYASALGQGATKDGQSLRTGTRQDLVDADILATRPNMEPQHWRSLPPVKRHHRPSLAYRFCLVAEGHFDAMLSLRDAWEWDIAAGSLIAAEAGAAVSDRHGSALRFNRPDPASAGLVIANPVLHEKILSALR